MYQFWSHCVLDTDFVSRLIMSGAYRLYDFKIGIPNLVCGCILGLQGVMYQFWGHCDPDIFSTIIVSGAYLL